MYFDSFLVFVFVAISQEKTLQSIENFDKTQLKPSQTSEPVARKCESIFNYCDVTFLVRSIKSF